MNSFTIDHRPFILLGTKLRFGRDVGHVLQEYLERFAKWPLKPPLSRDLNLLPGKRQGDQGAIRVNSHYFRSISLCSLRLSLRSAPLIEEVLR